MASTLERAGEHLAGAVRTLADIGGDVETARQLLALLGWALPPAVDDIGLTGLDVSTLANKIEELIEVRSRENASDLEIATAAAEVVLALENAFDAIQTVAESLQATPQYLQATDIVNQLLPRIADLLVIQAVGSAAPAAVPLGVLLGVFELEMMPADPAIFQVRHVRRTVRWDRLSSLIDDPTAVLHDVYGWGTAEFQATALLTNISRVLEHFGADVIVRKLPREAEEQVVGHAVPEADAAPAPQFLVSLVRDIEFGALDVGISLFPLRPSAPAATDAGLAVSPYAFGTTDLVFPLSDTLSLVLSGTADLEGGVVLLLRPERDPDLMIGLLDVPRSGAQAVSFGIGVRHSVEGARTTLFSAPAVVVDAAAIGGGIGISAGASLNPSFHAAIEDGRVRIVADRSDGFLASVLPAEGITATVNLDVSWSRENGVRIHGGAGLHTTLGLHLRIGPLAIDTLDLAITATGQAVTGAATIAAAALLGPFTASLAGMGAAAVLRFERGNLGPLDLSVDFVPPTIVGLAIDAGVIEGGGLIRYDPAAGRYSGMLELRAGEISITGVGLVDARLPNNAPGFALLIALRATFPGIQIGLGFALTSVGGLLALNRRVDVDALRARLASGIAGRILAPADPIRNAPALLADLDAVFPIAMGVTVIGPTIGLVWAELVHFDIGVFIELPGPARIVILGSAHASIESGDRTYLVIRVDVVGVVDLQRRLAAFDAVLIDSTLLEVLDLTGGAAFRLSWGDQPYAVFTLGGFHPAYNPEPLVFPSTLTRIAMVRGKPTDRLYLRFEGYFAVTTNTLQFGAAVEAIINAGNFNIQGLLGFDALIRFQPFHFEVDIRASVRVRYKSRSFGSLTLTGSLTGPGPVVLRAKVCIELLFFDVCFSDTFRLGSSVAPAIQVLGSALDVFVAELDRPATLRASETTDRYVALRPAPEGSSRPILTPAGQLVWVQRAAPLGLLLQRIGGTPLGVPQSVEATSAAAAGPEVDWFAPGSFADLTDDQALTRRGFERLAGGLRLGAPGTGDGPAAQRTLTIKQIRLPAKAKKVRDALVFPEWVVNRSGRRTSPVVAAIAVGDEQWTLTDPATGQTTSGLSAAQAHMLASLSSKADRRVAAVRSERLADLVF